MLQAELKILGGKHKGKAIALNSKKFLVGREQDCHLRPNSDLVSRHHCVFSIDDYAVRLRDLGSTNGTLVNGESLRGEVNLKSGDRVSIGKLELEVVIRQSAAKLGANNSPEPASTVAAIGNLTSSEETETSYELATFQTPPQVDSIETSVVAPLDTAIISTIPPQNLQMGGAGYPPGYPSMMPPGYQMPGAYPQQQYPQPQYQQPQYPQPQYQQYPPGYGQPMGYPMGQPMGYPQMMPMQPGYPGVSVAAPPVAMSEPEEEVPTGDSEILAVRLPDPSDTGAKPAVSPAAAGGAPQKKEEKPSTSAADIIKQYMNRRG